MGARSCVPYRAIHYPINTRFPSFRCSERLRQAADDACCRSVSVPRRQCLPRTTRTRLAWKKNIKKRIRAAMADIRSIGTILRTTEHLETNQRADVSQSWLRLPWALTLRGNLRSGLSGKGRAMFPGPPTAPTAAVLGPWTTPPPCASSLLLLR
jgi:hypothetical protein